MSTQEVPKQSLAGMHWYHPDTSMLDELLPKGSRGWNVEVVFGVKNTVSLNVAYDAAKIARDAGLINIIRIDYLDMHPVPRNSNDYHTWVTGFTTCVQKFTSGTEPVARIFIVGNEPTIEPSEGQTTATEYATAFNHIYSKKSNLGSDIMLLAAGPAAFSGNPRRIEADPPGVTFLDWLEIMSGKLDDVDGFAIHTYGAPSCEFGCHDPAARCTRMRGAQLSDGKYTFPNGQFDGGFSGFKEQIERISKKWGKTAPIKPIYITEFNTDVNGLKWSTKDKDDNTVPPYIDVTKKPDPDDDYPDGWINKAFEVVRAYNAQRDEYMCPVLALCWFVDRAGAAGDDTKWKSFALSVNTGRLKDARQDMHDEFFNRANVHSFVPFAQEAFDRQWAKSDRLLMKTQTARSWTWGPQPITQGILEDYKEAPGGKRLVQYFDKARMEFNPRTSPPGPHPPVTNGLLVREMIDRKCQTGDADRVCIGAANFSCAGDEGGGAPTYEALRKVASPSITAKVARRTNQIVAEIINTDGTLDTTAVKQAEVRAYQIVLTGYDDTLGHNIPKIFMDFFARTGQIYDYGIGNYRDDTVFNWMETVGLPLMEPHWTWCKVGGTSKWILIQAFERRMLTFNNGNSDGWKVEMGNVGTHYYQWRYNKSLPTTQVANLQNQNVPANMGMGQRVAASVTMHNTGTTSWMASGNGVPAASAAQSSSPASRTKASAAQPSGAGNTSTTGMETRSTSSASSGDSPRLELVSSAAPWDVRSVALPRSVPPGTSVKFDFEIAAPREPGHYDLQMRMARGDGTWMGNYLTNAVRVNVGNAPGNNGPTGLVAYVRNPREILFSWNAVSWADGYVIEVANTQSDLLNKTGSWMSWHTNKVNEAPHNNLQPGTTLFWRVYAFVTNGSWAYGYPEQPSVTTPRPPDYSGSLDAVNCAMIAGWAWDRLQPNTPINLDVYADNVRIDTVAADKFRPDLPGAGIGNGYHAFGCVPPERLFDGVAHTIKVAIAGAPTVAYTNPTPFLGRMATYTGRVICPNGGDGVGAQVTLLLNNEPVRQTVADANGAYRFERVRVGSGLQYALKASKQWHTPSSIMAFQAGINDQNLDVVLTHQTYTVHGKVTTQDFGSIMPVPNVPVKLLGGSGQPVNTGSQEPDKGVYKFEGVLAGREYTVQPEHLYYSFAPTNQRITLLDANRELNFQAARITRKLTIQVLDDSQTTRPMSGVTVKLTRKDGVEPPREASTGNDGRCIFEGLKTGRDYSVSFTKQYHRFFPPTVDTPPLTGTTGDLADLLFGCTGQRIHHNISGKIIAEPFLRDPENPVPGVSLNMILNGVPSAVDYRTVDGGIFIVRQPEGWGYQIQPSHAYFTFEPHLRQINGLSQDLPNQNFVAKRKKFPISGFFKDAGGRPVRDIKIKAVWKSSSANIGSANTVSTNSGGWFNHTETLAGVRYSLEPELPANMAGFHVAPFIFHTAPVLTAPMENINFVAGCNVEGRLTDIKGNPISGVTLTIAETNNVGSPLTTQTDAQGNYRFEHVAPGYHYLVTPAKSGMMFAPSSQMLSSLSSSARADFTGGHHISGRIEDNFATPRTALSGVKVVMECAPPLPAQYTETEQTTDNLGMYHFATLFPPGITCTVRPSKQGMSFDPPSRSKSDLQYHQPFGFYGGHSIGGRVTALNGKPMAGVDVTLSRIRADGAPVQSKVVTDAEGNYAFKSIAPGRYTLAASSAGETFLPPSRTIDNLNSDQTLNFAQVLIISGTLRDNRMRTPIAGHEVQLTTEGQAGGGVVRASVRRPEVTMTDAKGRYSFTIQNQATSYTVRPASYRDAFEPESKTLTGLLASQVVDFDTRRAPLDNRPDPTVPVL